MSTYLFLFLNQRAYWFARHFTFWAGYYLYIFIDHFSGAGFANFFQSSLYIDSFQEASIFLPVFLFAVYTTLYFIVPKCLLQKRPGLLFASFFVIEIVVFVTFYFIYDRFIIPNDNYPQRNLDVISATTLQSVSKLIIITGVALIIKLIKYHSVKQREHEQLLVENVENKLPILKARLHPQIIFESLHSIEQDIDAGAHQAYIFYKLQFALTTGFTFLACRHESQSRFAAWHYAIPQASAAFITSL